MIAAVHFQLLHFFDTWDLILMIASFELELVYCQQFMLTPVLGVSVSVSVFENNNEISISW